MLKRKVSPSDAWAEHATVHFVSAVKNWSTVSPGSGKTLVFCDPGNFCMFFPKSPATAGDFDI